MAIAPRAAGGEPTNLTERHPIPDAPLWPLEDRVRHLELHLAMLWDEVWWHQLPFWRRWYYLAQGFRSPISRFYESD